MALYALGFASDSRRGGRTRFNGHPLSLCGLPLEGTVVHRAAYGAEIFFSAGFHHP